MRAIDLLKKAGELVSGERADQHGPMYENHTCIARMWNAYLANRDTPYHQNLTASDVAIMMALLKIARTQRGEDNPDDLVDAAGYVAVASQVQAPPLTLDDAMRQLGTKNVKTPSAEQTASRTP